MQTTHGAHIPGTRLGRNPPILSPRCGGVNHCPDCMLEAHAVNRLDYYREDTYSSLTPNKVYEILCTAGITSDMAKAAIAALDKGGILFRERKHQ